VFLFWGCGLVGQRFKDITV
jgi:hypothetical protein